MKNYVLTSGFLITVLLFFDCTGNTGSNEISNQANLKDMKVTVDTLKQVLQLFNKHDLDAIMNHFAEDCSLDMPRGPEYTGKRYTGKDQVREALAGRFKGIPDVHYGEDVHWLAGDRGVSEWTLTGTTTAGVPIKVRGCDLWEFSNGKIKRKDSYWKIVE